MHVDARTDVIDPVLIWHSSPIAQSEAAHAHIALWFGPVDNDFCGVWFGLDEQGPPWGHGLWQRKVVD